MESWPSVTAPDFKKTAPGGGGEGVAQHVCLLDRREAVLAHLVPEDLALDSPRDLATALGVSFLESVDGVRWTHSADDTGLAKGTHVTRLRAGSGLPIYCFDSLKKTWLLSLRAEAVGATA